MPPIQINNLDLESHKSYAHNREQLDTKYITESTTINHYSEIAGTSTIFPSQLELFIGISKGNLPWGSFEPPPHYQQQANRFFFFSLCLFLSPLQNIEAENPFITAIESATKEEGQKMAEFEKEKTILINFLKCTDNLNEILKSFRMSQCRIKKS